MTITARIVRVWPGRRAQIIVSVPHRVLRYSTVIDGRLTGGTWATVEKERADVYCWMTDVRGQLVASVCEQAAHQGFPVRLTGNETAYGWVVTNAEPAQPQEAA